MSAESTTHPERRRRRRWIRRGAWLVLLAATTAATFGSGVWLSLRVGVRSAVDIVVPSLLGLDAETARQQLQGVGLGLEQLGQRSDPAIPLGRIVEQTPAPGSKTKAGRAVHVMLSLGPMHEQMPNLVGATTARVQLSLEASHAGIPSSASAPHTTTPKGQVIWQDPPAGTALSSGAGIRLLYSSGPPVACVVMPDLVNRISGPAVAVLIRQGFSRIDVDGAAPDPSRSSLVLEQTPPAGARLCPNDWIHLKTRGGAP